MFTEDNTEGFTKEQLEQMNHEFYEEMKQFDLTQMSYSDYSEEEKRASEKILKKWGGA